MKIEENKQKLLDLLYRQSLETNQREIELYSPGAWAMPRWRARIVRIERFY